MALIPWPDEEKPLPPVSRRRDPETSKAAERMIAAKRPSLMVHLLYAYEEADCTDEEAADWAALLNPGLWKRCSDLRNLGLIEPTGHTRKASTGMQQMVCQITDEGRRVLRERKIKHS